jgi:hypothetical protein
LWRAWIGRKIALRIPAIWGMSANLRASAKLRSESVMNIMRMNLTLLAVSATLAFGVLMQEVNAAASVSLCNDGDVVVKAVIIDNRKHHMDGWYEINPHRCGGMTSGGSVDLTVGLFTRDWYAESEYVKYYDFDPPKIYKPGLMWIPDNEIRVD